MSDYDLFEFRHLKFFAAIAESGNLTVAAGRLNTTQSNLSTQIKQLEGIVDTELLQRDRDGVSLTSSGHVLLAGAREALQLREEIVDLLKALGTTKLRPVRLGFSSLVEQRLLDSICNQMRQLLPGTEVRPIIDEVETLESRVREGELHGALITLPLADTTDLTSVIVDKEPLVVCLPNDDVLAAHHALPAHTLSGKLGIFDYPASHAQAHKRLLELFEEVGIVPLQLHPTVNFEHVQWMVLQRECFALIRGRKNIMPGLTTRPIHGAAWTVDTAVITPSSMQHPALTLLIREARRSMRRSISSSAEPPQASVRKRDARGHRKSRSQSVASMSLFRAD